MLNIKPLTAAEGYVQRLTGRKGFFTFLNAGRNKAAIFRRLNFIPPDELTMIRLRLLSEVTPKVQTSVLNGFLVGEIQVDGKGRMVRGLDANRCALLDYLLREPMGAYMVEKLGATLFQIHYPGDWVETLIARAARLTGGRPIATVKNHRWQVRVGSMTFEIERFREACRVRTTPAQFLALIKAAGIERDHFLSLPRPCVLTAFGRTVAVSGSIYPASERQGQLPDLVFMRLFAAYERAADWNAHGLFGRSGGLAVPAGATVKSIFLSGRRRKVSPRWQLPEINSLPVPALVVPAVEFKTRSPGPRPRLDAPIPACAGRKLYQELVRQQYVYLRGCIHPEVVRARINRRTLVGRMSAPDHAIYPPIWVPDHFFNCLAMVDLDPALARRMILGGFAACMQSSGERKGQIHLKRWRDTHGSTYPLWAPACQRLFARTGDRSFVRQVWPCLQMNNAYHNRFYLKDGIYVGAGGFWNDYSRGPKELPFVAGIGMNSLLALQKRIAFELGHVIGVRDERLRDEYESLKDNINRRFWDEQRGFYFDFDHQQRQIYTTARGGRFFGLDNLLPLFAGIVPANRIAAIARYLTSSQHYGRYPAITTDLSDDFMDDRRLMVWIMTNWLVIQGLRSYRLHAIAAAIARQIFNALLRSWGQDRSLPEALGGNLGLCPMENRTMAGVGCWTGFWLYLKETLPGHVPCGPVPRNPRRPRGNRADRRLHAVLLGRKE